MRWLRVLGVWILVMVVFTVVGGTGTAWAQGPGPTPDVQGEAKNLEQQAQDELNRLSAETQGQLDRLSADAQNRLNEETARLEAEARQQAANQAGGVVRSLTRQIEQALLGLVAQVCGATPALIILGALGLAWRARAG